MKKQIFFLFEILFVFGIVCASAGENAPGKTVAKIRYEPNWESLDKRPIPEWFNETKFGIFVVWGPYSVPAYVDKGYAEWYGWKMYIEDSPTRKFHVKNYGEDFKYEQFAGMFTAEMWDPDFWIDLFVKSGAKYVVTTANYHDGFALWPTKYARTVNTDKWNSMVTGPERDLLGELNEAGRKRGLKMGIYYSLYEWWHPLWLTDRDRYVTEHLHPKFKEVVTKYKPPVIFLDGEWEMDYKKWRSEELAAWLFNDSPVADEVVVNDRWGQCRSEHGSYYSSEYGGGEYPPTHPWQEDRGIGHSYGYNRNESIYDYDSAEDLIRLFSKICANGGNLLLDVGPTADGRIPVIMQERLLQIGEWLKANGDAIYGSRTSPFWPRRFCWGVSTCKPGKIFLHIHDQSQKEIYIRGINNRVNSVYFLSNKNKKQLPTSKIQGGIKIELPEHMPNKAVSVIALEIEGEPDVDRMTEQYDDGSVYLHCYSMDIHGTNAQIQINGYQKMVHIGNWTDPEEWVSCDFNLWTPCIFDLEVTYSCDAASSGSEFTVSIDNREFSGKTRETGSWNSYETQSLGKIKLDKTGRYTIVVKPASKPEWKSMGLKAITLKPIKP